MVEKGYCMYHMRVRPTALILKDEHVLLIEYRDEHGVHYNLPGGGAEPGETLEEGAAREVWEETRAEVEVGPVALLYECAPHRQSGEYDSPTHTLSVIFECRLKEGSRPRMPDVPDRTQSAVRWVHLNELDSIVMFPRIQRFIKQFARRRTTVPMINDYELQRYSDG